MTDINAVEILIVEDTPQDLELTLRALKKANLTNHIQVVRDGAEASGRGVDLVEGRDVAREAGCASYKKHEEA